MPSAPSIGRGLLLQQSRTKGGPRPATCACWVQQHVWSLSRTAAGVAECAHGLSGRCTQAHTFSSTVQPATLLLQPHAWPRGWAPSFVQYTAGVLTRSGHRRTQLSVAGRGGTHDILHAASAETHDIYTAVLFRGCICWTGCRDCSAPTKYPGLQQWWRLQAYPWGRGSSCINTPDLASIWRCTWCRTTTWHMQ